jgi:glutamate--cysteine ligase catalytic subunit
MGLLVDGHPLSWAEASEFLDYVREHGVQQLLHVYDRMKHHEACECQLFWGDEVEYMVLHVDKEEKHITLNLRGSEILRELEEDEQQAIEAWVTQHLVIFN